MIVLRRKGTKEYWQCGLGEESEYGPLKTAKDAQDWDPEENEELCGVTYVLAWCREGKPVGNVPFPYLQEDKECPPLDGLSYKSAFRLYDSRGVTRFLTREHALDHPSCSRTRGHGFRPIARIRVLESGE